MADSPRQSVFARRIVRRIVATAVVVAVVTGYGLWAHDAQERAIAEVAARANSSTPGTFLKNGTFEGQARGFGGMMTVAATVENGYITKIEVVQTSDDEPYIGRATDQMPFRIAYSQAFTTDDVDTVAGATISSRGILNATNNALVGAGAAEGEKAGPAANSKTGAKSTDELKQMAASRHEEEAKPWYETSWFDQFGEEEEYYGRHDSSANVSGGFAGGV